MKTKCSEAKTAKFWSKYCVQPFFSMRYLSNFLEKGESERIRSHVVTVVTALYCLCLSISVCLCVSVCVRVRVHVCVLVGFLL